jgi:acyl carrier protein
MTADEIKAALLDEIGNIAPEADLAALQPDVDFREELDIDSIGFLNLIIALDRRLGVQVPEADYPKLASLNGAVAYLTALSPRGAAS